MKEVINEYRKLIWIWTIVCTTGLLIRILKLTGDINVPHVKLFTTLGGYYSDQNDKGFWPLVKFIKHHDTSSTYGHHGNDYTSFNGIFYGFDISEFIVYMLILIGFLIYKAYIAKPVSQPTKSN